LLQCIDLRRALQVKHHLEPSSEHNVWGETEVTLAQSPNARPRNARQSFA
jgi:hypothetical protein